MFLVLETSGVRRWVGTNTIRQLQSNDAIVCVFETMMPDHAEDPPCNCIIDLKQSDRMLRLIEKPA